MYSDHACCAPFSTRSILHSLFLACRFSTLSIVVLQIQKKTNPFLYPFGTIVTSIFNRIFHVEDSRNRKLLICHWFCVMILQNVIHFIDEIYWNEYGKLYHLQKCTALMKRRRNSAHAILTIKPKWNEKKKSFTLDYFNFNFCWCPILPVLSVTFYSSNSSHSLLIRCHRFPLQYTLFFWLLCMGSHCACQILTCIRFLLEKWIQHNEGLFEI